MVMGAAVTHDWHWIGLHRFQFQGDVLLAEPHGELLLPEAEGWSTLISAFFERVPHGFLLVDARDLKPPGGAIRRLFLAWLQERQPRPRIVVFGANLLMRAASRLVLAAARQLYRLELDLTQCETEAAARAHIEQQRRLP